MKLLYSIKRINFRRQVPRAGVLVKRTSQKSFFSCVYPRLIIVLFLFVFSFPSLPGTKGQIEGMIVDGKTGKALSYVNVIVLGTSLAVDCKSDGSYHIMDVPPGEYEIQLRGIGYLPLTVKSVIVEADHSTTLNFELFSPRELEDKYVTETAKEEILKMDVSARRYYSNIEEIREIPMVSDLEDYISFYSLHNRLGFMGRKNTHVLYITDGFTVLDNRLNNPAMMPPLSAVKNVVFLDGGFDSEYGNIGFLIVNVVEEEGNRYSYHGSANLQYTFPHMPHYGNSIFSTDNVHVRPFVDTTDSLCWKGTSVLPEEQADEYESFEGWIEYAESRREMGDTLTPREWRDLFRYVYRIEGSESLGQIPGSYGDKWGRLVDFSFGGPFPGVNIVTFLVSNSRREEPFSIPVSRENYADNKTDLKITLHLKPEMKLNIKGLFEDIKTVTTDSREIYYDGEIWFESGNILNSVAGKDFMYWVDALNPYDINRYGWGLDFNHNLTPSTYYTLRLFYSSFRHSSVPIWKDIESAGYFRDTTEIISFGNVSIPREVPFGYESFAGNECYYRNLLPSDFFFSNFGRAVEDASWINTVNFSSEVTSEISSHHELKGGMQINYDRIHSYLSASITGGTEEIIDEINWSGEPYRSGFYAQYKFSGEDLVAKFGLRLDYYRPDERNYGLRLSPRLGMSYPLKKFGKFYFNFGYFYDLPESEKLLGEFNRYGEAIVYFGNPRLDLPKVVSYELGYEKDLFDQYLLRISGYFNDYSEQIGEINYDDHTGISYTTYANNMYGNLRGFEFSLRKRYGRLFKGFLVYNLETGSYGKLEGSEVQVKSNPEIRFLLIFNTPGQWGKMLKDVSASLLYTRTGGDYFSYDPYASDPFFPDDPTYKNNLKWQDEGYWDLRLSKNFSPGRFNVSFYAEINNLFDSKYLTGDSCFRVDSANTDKLEYLSSLHLPMYNDRRYASDASLVGGDDKVGEVDKDYIDKPALEYLYYTNPRFLRLGLRVEF